MKRILLSLSILLTSFFAIAQAPEQWRKVNGAIYSVVYAPTNPNLILLTTEDGVIRKSVDGGVTWKEKSAGSFNVITSLKAFSNTHFIGVNSMSEVVLSTDAGDSWSTLILKDTLGNKIQMLTEIVVMSETEAIVKTVAANPTSLYTDDKGLTWSYKKNQPKSLFMVNDTLIGIDHLQFTQFTKAFGVLRSTNKGETYDTISILPTGLSGNDFNNQFKKGYENISFVNAKTWFINVNAKTFYRTTDGGLTFTEIKYGAYVVREMSFLSSTEGFVSLFGNNSVQYTKDGGATWTPVKNVGSFSGPSVMKHSHKNNGQLFMVDYYNSYTIDSSMIVSLPQNVAPTNLTKASIINDTILLTPFENYFFKSVDGGMTWNKTNQILTEFNDKVTYDSYATVGNDTIFVNANTRIYRSTNGGNSFSLIHTTTRFNPQYTYFKHLKEDDLVLVGNGVIKYTLDGGATFTEYNTGTFHSPRTIEVASLKAIYGLDYSNNVVFSSDSGKIFAMANGNLPSRTNATKLMFVNDSVGFLYGNQSFLFKTEDRGATWKNLKDSLVGDGRFFNWDAMASNGEKEIYIMDADGNGGAVKIFYSLDGGNTWSKSTNNLHLADPKFMAFKSGAQGLATGTASVYRSGFDAAVTQEIVVDNIVTGVNDFALNGSNVSFYPNPCSNQFTITSATEIIKLEVINARGELVATKNTDTNKLELDGFSLGIYLVKVYTSNDIQTIKIIKN